jgi:hypothetical protein
MKLKRMLQEWSLNEQELAPSRNPLRTEACLNYQEVEDAALAPDGVQESRLTHIIECANCRKNWLTFKRLAHTEIINATFQKATEPAGDLVWSPEQSIEVSAYLNSATYLARENQIPLPAHVDREGTLRVHWSGLQQEGQVSVVLQWEEYSVPLASGMVQGGVLEIVEPLPHLHLRNLELSAAVLSLQPLES